MPSAPYKDPEELSNRALVGQLISTARDAGESEAAGNKDRLYGGDYSLTLLNARIDALVLELLHRLGE